VRLRQRAHAQQGSTGTIGEPRSAGHGRLKGIEDTQREKYQPPIQAARPQPQAARTTGARSARAVTAEDGALVGGLTGDHVKPERLRLRLQQHLEHLLALLRQALLAACASIRASLTAQQSSIALPARLNQVCLLTCACKISTT